MSMRTEGIFKFGEFQIDALARTLRREEEIVTLNRRAFDVLLYLVQNPGKVVTRDELLKNVWSDTFVDENSLAQSISALRRALDEKPGDNSYIVTLPGRGYQFVTPVQAVVPQSLSMVPDAAAGDSQGPRALLFQERTIRTSVVTEEKLRLSSPIPRRLLLALAFCLAALLCAAWFRPVTRPPQVTRVRQITHIGTVVSNQNLLVTGSRIYFMAVERGENQLRYVSLDNDAVFPVEKPFPATEIFDILPSANELLIGEGVHGYLLPSLRRTLWRLPLPGGTPRRVGTAFADDAAWSPDGRTIAYTNEPDHSVNLMDADGGNLRKLSILPGVPFKIRWSPDGKLIRMSVLDPKGRGISLWQLDASGHDLTRMLPGWSEASRAWAGRWTRDGRYFLFTGLHAGTRNIWALRENRSFLRRDGAQPVQLTDGPLDFYLPVPSRDSKTIYAVGTHLQGQLMHYSTNSRQFEPYANGPSADQVVFSRDGQWMAYVGYPEGALIRSRLDGSDRLQLTFAPMRAFSPRWSPDGSLIAFEGAPNVGATHKLYAVLASGGSPRLLLPASSSEQMLPDWSADGQSLLFGSSDESGLERAVYALNMKTGAQTVVSGTLGMAGGRMSPDGRYFAGLSVSGQSLLLHDMLAGATRQLAEFADYPQWSPDGKYIFYSNFSLGVTLPPDKAGVFRVRVADGSVERVAPAPAFALTGNWGLWSGPAPDGSMLVLRELGISDIYALDADLP